MSSQSGRRSDRAPAGVRRSACTYRGRPTGVRHRGSGQSGPGPLSTLILDCSAAVALVLPDESSAAVQAHLTRQGPDLVRVVVPSLWWYECTNVLLQAARRGRLELAEAREALSLLARLPHETRDAASLIDAVHLFHLSTQFSITAYDAAYLALAETTGGSLLTLDKRLRDAAHDIDVDAPDLEA
ncbi:MAG: PIN domain-containing protein [Spirochaetaceae bacterium]|nr:MAG: PIN domain-containing protein [Spirochaetaceae bacterium]